MRIANALGRGAGVIAVLCLTTVGCRGSKSEKPPIHPNPNMDQQLRYDAQEPSTFFADGRSARPRVEGTVHHLAAVDPHLGEGKAGSGFANTMPANDEHGQPMTLTKEFLERGQERYHIYCVPCHDVTGSGNGIVVERGFLKPPNLNDVRLLGMPVGQLYDIVKNGARNMPGYGPQLSIRDRWAVAAYVRVLQLSRNATLEQIPADMAAKNRWEVQ